MSIVQEADPTISSILEKMKILGETAFKAGVIEGAKSREGEIERLKGLIEKAHLRGWLDCPADEYQTNPKTLDQSYKEFAKENNL